MKEKKHDKKQGLGTTIDEAEPVKRADIDIKTERLIKKRK